MPSFYEITFLPEGSKERHYGSRGNYYVLQDESHLDLICEPIWCHLCGDFSEGERLGTLVEIDRELADLHDPSSHLYRMMMMSAGPELDALLPRESFRSELTANAQKRRRWRESRSSPPKCIRCGSTRIVAFNTEFNTDKPVPHPSGSGELLVRWLGMCSTGWNEWYFSPEGDRLPEGDETE